MADIAELSLVAAILFAGYLSVQCITPPNPTPKQTWKKDFLRIYGSSTLIGVMRVVLALPFIYHASLVLALPQPKEQLCLHPDHLKRHLFTWNSTTVASLLLIFLVGAPLRFGAFNGLGKNFTFGLAAPDKLTTDGIYKYIQHPSYTGLSVVIIAIHIMILRWDAAPGCLIPNEYFQMLDGWGYAGNVAFLVILVQQVFVRVWEEEAMLKEVFGAEWERWHTSTARFIPWII